MLLTEYDVHPAATIFPMMDRISFDALKRDIDEHGVKECITIWEDRIIDGRNRYKAMRELGIDPACHAAELEQCDDPISYVLSLNLHRRHLNESQRAMVAAEIATLKNGEIGNGRKVGPSLDEPTRESAANLLNVSTASVDRAKKVKAAGAASVIQMVTDGELPVAVAEKFVKAVPDKKEQAKTAKGGVKAVKESIKQTPKPKAKKQEPRHSYFEQFKSVWDEADANGRAAIVAFVMDYAT